MKIECLVKDKIYKPKDNFQNEEILLVVEVFSYTPIRRLFHVRVNEVGSDVCDNVTMVVVGDTVEIEEERDGVIKSINIEL